MDVNKDLEVIVSSVNILKKIQGVGVRVTMKEILKFFVQIQNKSDGEMGGVESGRGSGWRKKIGGVWLRYFGGRVGGQGGCERKIDVFVKIKK